MGTQSKISWFEMLSAKYTLKIYPPVIKLTLYLVINAFMHRFMWHLSFISWLTAVGSTVSNWSVFRLFVGHLWTDLTVNNSSSWLHILKISTRITQICWWFAAETVIQQVYSILPPADLSATSPHFKMLQTNPLRLQQITFDVVWAMQPVFGRQRLDWHVASEHEVWLASRL
jgi:hypothetical protein